MAGVKVTDLTSTSTAAATDVFYIVDTGSNTSKQIEVGNIYSGMPQLESGSYTPVASNETNSATINTSIGDAHYIKVGNVVIFTAVIQVVMDAGSDNTEFNLSLPVPTTFTTTRQAWGSNNTYTFLKQVEIISDDVNTSDIKVTVIAENNGDDIGFLTLTVQYLVL
jgi:hypothetical protein